MAELLLRRPVRGVRPISAEEEWEEPDFRKVRNYLKRIGARHIGNVGDHEVWQLPGGQRIHLNRGKQKQKTDIASVKSLAIALGMTMNGLRDAVNDS